VQPGKHCNLQAACGNLVYLGYRKSCKSTGFLVELYSSELAAAGDLQDLKFAYICVGASPTPLFFENLFSGCSYWHCIFVANDVQ
jgi:hypothetical protein